MKNVKGVKLLNLRHEKYEKKTFEKENVQEMEKLKFTEEKDFFLAADLHMTDFRAFMRVLLGMRFYSL